MSGNFERLAALRETEYKLCKISHAKRLLRVTLEWASIFFILIAFFFLKLNYPALAKDNFCELKFIVTVPDYTSQDAKIYITGNKDILKNWNPQGIRLKPIRKNTYQLNFKIPVKSILEFKFTQGAWKTVEVDKNFHSIPNRVLFISNGQKEKKNYLNIENWAKKNKTPPKSTLSGNIKAHKDFYSKFLHNKREILVYLPPGYDKKISEHYPVLYLHDGKNVFDEATSFGGIEWGLDETAEKLIKEEKMKEIIMVAIYNNEDRINEYTFIRDIKHGGGKAKMYADFIIKELKPFIDKHYRTLKSASQSAILGSSLGGLCSLYIGWKNPKIFSMLGVVSPSLWWHNNAIIKLIENDRGGKKSLKIWLDMGTYESDEDKNKNGIFDILDETRQLKKILIKKGYLLNQELYYYEDSGAIHNEDAWKRRAEKILLFFFKR
ncbi:MAG: esterase [Armatimonadetes bacterium]|nr:esterase [Armatimonadota bacterium]